MNLSLDPFLLLGYDFEQVTKQSKFLHLKKEVVRVSTHRFWGQITGTMVYMELRHTEPLLVFLLLLTISAGCHKENTHTHVKSACSYSPP